MKHTHPAAMSGQQLWLALGAPEITEADEPRPATRQAFRNPRAWAELYVADVDEAGKVIDAAWVSSPDMLEGWMQANRLTGDPRTVRNVAESIERDGLERIAYEVQ